MCMLVLAFKTYRTMTVTRFLRSLQLHIQILQETMSAVTKKHNNLMFWMLVVQAVVPLICLHIPAMLLFLGPIFVTLPLSLSSYFDEKTCFQGNDWHNSDDYIELSSSWTLGRYLLSITKQTPSYSALFQQEKNLSHIGLSMRLI